MKLLLLFALALVICSSSADDIDITSNDIRCGTLTCPKETVSCFSSSSTRNAETKHFAQCIDENGKVLLEDNKQGTVDALADVKLPSDWDILFGTIVTPIDTNMNPSHIFSTPIANTESFIETYKPSGTHLEVIPAIESSKQQIEAAKKTVEFWRNYVERINLDLQDLPGFMRNNIPSHRHD